MPTSHTPSPRPESTTSVGPRSSSATPRIASRPSPPSRDTWDMRARLTSSRFVGRVGELAELELAWREAAANRPVLVLLGGESGVGKTRLVAEFEHRMSEAAVTVLRGEAVEQSDGELPYAPLLGALRPLVRERDPVLQ